MTALPPDLLIGKVVGRWIDTLADTPTDPDTTPDVTPSTGVVTMSRLQTFSSFMDAEQADGTMVGVRQRRFVLELDETGEVRVPGATVPGVWVPHGWYRVDALIDGAPWPSFQIEVTAAHTAESPLDLVAESPIVAEPGARLVVSAAVALRAEDAAVRAEAAQAAAEATVTTAGQILAGAQAALPAAVSDYLTANPPEDGTDGRPVELQVGATHVQWRYQGDVAWTDLISLAALIGAPGSPGASAYDVAVSNGFPGTEAEWLASLDGEDGDNGLSVELRATGTHIQWRQEGGTWADLVALSAITGPQGPQGVQGEIGPAGADGEDLTHSTPQTINAQTGTTYTLVAADASKLVTCTNAGAITLTVPANVFSAGQRVDVAQRGAGGVTNVAGSGMTVNPPPGMSLVSEGQFAYWSLFFISATEADVVGMMAAAT